jgi:hypothetical protein
MLEETVAHLGRSCSDLAYPVSPLPQGLATVGQNAEVLRREMALSLSLLPPHTQCPSQDWGKRGMSMAPRCCAPGQALVEVDLS